MKPRSSNQTSRALTLLEVMLVIAGLAVLVAVLLRVLAKANRRESRIKCVNKLKEIGLAYRVWEGDNGDKYPMFVSVTNGGAMELIATGNVAACFQVMSNELSTPRILHCEEDTEHIEAYSFAMLASSNISYFVGVDVTNEVNPQAILSGDDNFEISGLPVKSGLLEIPSNAQISWTATRHKLYGYHGNLLIADGSVQQVTQNGLRQAIQNSGMATNRLVIP